LGKESIIVLDLVFIKHSSFILSNSVLLTYIAFFILDFKHLQTFYVKKFTQFGM